jgi:5'-3' exonuclease
MRRTFLLDGTALAYRAHFAFTGRSGGLTTSTGHPTSATYGFLLTLRALLQSEEPDRIAVAFDGPRENLHRVAIYPEYKATREKAPDELVVQFDDLRELVEAYGIPILELPGQEADDVIGTLAVQCKDEGDEVYIVTADKDFMQLVEGEAACASTTSAPNAAVPRRRCRGRSRWSRSSASRRSRSSTCSR